MFSKKESKIYLNWLMDKPICEIAHDVKVTEGYVNDVLRKINSQINLFEDSVKVLQQLGIIRKINPPKQRHVSYVQTKAIARRFVQEIFNDRKIEAAKNFVTPDIIYHGMFEEVRGVEDFKQWIAEDLSAFPDMEITILDDFEEQNKVAMRWTAKATHEKDFAGLPATHKKIKIEGAEIFHFEGDKIKEAWTIFDALTPALQIGSVDKVQAQQSELHTS